MTAQVSWDVNMAGNYHPTLLQYQDTKKIKESSQIHKHARLQGC
jgi:hypothetical protein